VSKAPLDVSISYSTDAKAWAESISESLESKGVSTWMDFKNIQPGQRWLEEVQRALDEAKCFLLVAGPKNALGEWQDREWQGALQRTWTDPKKRIVPVLIDGATPPPFVKDWMFVRIESGKPESLWNTRIYDAVRGTGSGSKSASPKKSAKPGKEFRRRLDEIERVAKQMKSKQA